MPDPKGYLRIQARWPQRCHTCDAMRGIGRKILFNPVTKHVACGRRCEIGDGAIQPTYAAQRRTQRAAEE